MPAAVCAQQALGRAEAEADRRRLEALVLRRFRLEVVHRCAGDVALPVDLLGPCAHAVVRAQALREEVQRPLAATPDGLNALLGGDCRSEQAAAEAELVGARARCSLRFR